MVAKQLNRAFACSQTLSFQIRSPMSCNFYVCGQVNFTRINKMEVCPSVVQLLRFTRDLSYISYIVSSTYLSYATVKIHSKRSSSARMKIKTAGYLLTARASAKRVEVGEKKIISFFLFSSFDMFFTLSVARCLCLRSH